MVTGDGFVRARGGERLPEGEARWFVKNPETMKYYLFPEHEWRLIELFDGTRTREEIAEYYWKYFVTRDLLELRNIATVAQLVVECAASRRESRGPPATLDFPDLDPKFARDTVLKRRVPPPLRPR